MIGAGLAARVGPRLGPKFAVASGFAVLAGGLMLGASTTVTSGDGFLVLWTCLAGTGMGLALVTAANGAIGALSPERAGTGSALMQTVNKVGGPFGAAVLGSVLISVYQNHLNLAGLPAQAAEAVQKSVFGGLAVANQLGSAQLLNSVRTAFVAAFDMALWVSGGMAVVGVVLALAFMPLRSKATSKTPAEALELQHEYEHERIA